ncbi:MAG: hypothetical protein J3R72DRAFT_437621 [Linnemannia gamsii]|nr:MAG: hypothetical protein J3R72DRAFT_437621 [Linnemannia gamsii]
MRATYTSSLAISLLLALATLLGPIYAHQQHHQQTQAQSQEDSSVLASTINDAGRPNNVKSNELGIDPHRRRHLYQAIEHFYASVVEKNIRKRNIRMVQGRRIYKRQLLNDVLGDIVPPTAPNQDGSGSIEDPPATPDPTSASATTEPPTTTSSPVAPETPIDPVQPTVVPPTTEPTVPTVPPTTTDPTTPPPVTTDPTTPPPVTTDPTTPPPVTTDPTTPPPVTTDPTTPPPVTTDPTTPPPVTTPEPTPEPGTTTTTKKRTTTTTTSSSSRGEHTNPGPGPATSTSDGSTKPSNTASSGSTSSSNKTGITIGVVVGAIVIAGGIGVWVFRKWKLSPSRQFKSKIRNSAPVGGINGGMGGASGAAIGAAIGGDDDYDAYADIFRPQAHDSAVGGPAMASSMAPVSVAGSSPPMQHQQQTLPQTQSQYELGMYDQQAGQGGQGGQGHSPNHQHMSMSSAVTAATTVPDYSQYRYATGYESGIPESILGNGQGGHHTGYGQQQQQYEQPYSMFGENSVYHPEGSVSSNGRSTGHFLRELRE